jgi:hypothetical protein
MQEDGQGRSALDLDLRFELFQRFVSLCGRIANRR